MNDRPPAAAPTDSAPARPEPPPSPPDQPLVIPEATQPAHLAPSASARTSAARAHPQVRVARQIDAALGSWLGSTEAEAAQAERRDLNALVHRLLVIGLAISTALMVAGLALNLWRHQPLATTISGPSATFAAAIQAQPAGLLALGLLVLIATPIVRVIGSIIAFTFERDRRYALITLIVLSIVITSIVLGQH